MLVVTYPATHTLSFLRNPMRKPLEHVHGAVCRDSHLSHCDSPASIGKACQPTWSREVHSLDFHVPTHSLCGRRCMKGLSGSVA